MIAFIHFQVRYGLPSGPGADEEEHWESAWVIYSLVRGGVELGGLSLGGGEKAALRGKKWPSRAWFIGFGVSAPGWEGNRGGAQPEVNLFAVYRFWGVVECRKEDQCLVFAAFMDLT